MERSFGGEAAAGAGPRMGKAREPDRDTLRDQVKVQEEVRRREERTGAWVLDENGRILFWRICSRPMVPLFPMFGRIFVLAFR